MTDDSSSVLLENGQKEKKYEAEKVEEKESSSLRDNFKGLLLVIITNLCFIGTNYLVRWRHLESTEVALFRGVVQIVVFAPTVIIGLRKDKSKMYRDKSTVMLIVIYGALTALASFAIVTAVKIMPLGDMIVLCYLAPIFCLGLSRIFLKTPLTALKIFLSVSALIGEIFVVQPPGLFHRAPNTESEFVQDFDNITQNDVEIEPQLRKGELYHIGVSLALFAALGSSTCNIINSVTSKKGCTSSELVLSVGVLNVLLSMVATTFVSNRILLEPSTVDWIDLLALGLVSLLYCIGFFSLVTSINITRNPNLMTMLRTTEIPMSLVTESIWLLKIPNGCEIFGSLLVTVCVMMMSVHDAIMKRVQWLTKKPINIELKENFKQKS